MNPLKWLKQKNDQQIARRAKKNGTSVADQRKKEGYDQSLGGTSSTSTM